MKYFLCFIKTQPFVKRKPVKTEKKNTGTIAFRFRQVLLYHTNAMPLAISPHLQFIFNILLSIIAIYNRGTNF